MFSNRGPKGTFIQILQADHGLVYRLLIEHGGCGIDLTALAAYAGDARLDAVFRLPEGDAPSPLHDARSTSSPSRCRASSRVWRSITRENAWPA